MLKHSPFCFARPRVERPLLFVAGLCLIALSVDAGMDYVDAAPASEKAKATEVEAETKKEFVTFEATAYCLKGRTFSGLLTQPGVIAADRRILPIGTIIEVKAGSYSGTYTVLDTGALIKGKKLDIYLPTYKEAITFGRRPIKIRVVGRLAATELAAIRSGTRPRRVTSSDAD